VLYLYYQVFWGLLYFQPSILEKLPNHPIQMEELKALSLIFLDQCKESREHVLENKDGVFDITDLHSIKMDIVERQKKIPQAIYNNQSGMDMSIKASLFSDILSSGGILGYYNPISAEAQYDKNVPKTQIPFTICHETAHQLGFAREQEASFIGYLVGKDSKNSSIRYSTQYFVLKNLLQNIYPKDSVFAKTMVNQFSDGMKRDLSYEKKFRKEHESPLSILFSMTNDWFLKANQQDGSITYSYFIELLYRYETKELRFTTRFKTQMMKKNYSL
jgi:hypothetical protein